MYHDTPSLRLSLMVQCSKTNLLDSALVELFHLVRQIVDSVLLFFTKLYDGLFIL